ncbi:hypothetical protein T484DRAFT_1914443, partial [Baffinella frigidus]
MGGSSLAHGSFTKKTGKKGEAVCSAEKLVLDSTTAQALADSGFQQPGGGKFQKPVVSYPKPTDRPYGEAEMDDGAYISAKQGGGVKGVPVSGRAWKLDFKRSSAMVVSNKLIRKGWDAKMKEKQARKNIQDKEKKNVDERVQEKRDKKTKEEERKKRKDENILRSSTVQVVGTNTVKKMSRKQLRTVRKFQIVGKNTVKKMSWKQLRTVRKMDVNSEINPAPIHKTKGLKGKVIVKGLVKKEIPTWVLDKPASGWDRPASAYSLCLKKLCADLKAATLAAAHVKAMSKIQSALVYKGPPGSVTGSTRESGNTGRFFQQTMPGGGNNFGICWCNAFGFGPLARGGGEAPGRVPA